MKLAFIGSMNDEIIIMDELAIDLIAYLQEWYPSLLQERYSLAGGETRSRCWKRRPKSANATKGRRAGFKQGGPACNG